MNAIKRWGVFLLILLRCWLLPQRFIVGVNLDYYEELINRTLNLTEPCAVPICTQDCKKQTNLKESNLPVPLNVTNSTFRFESCLDGGQKCLCTIGK